MRFDPATFAPRRDPVQLAGHRDDVPARQGRHPMAVALFEAAERFAAREARNPGDDFARGKSATCRDLAERLDRFGSFVSDKQSDFAGKLVEWSKPRQQTAQAAPQATIPAVVHLPQLFTLMQRLSKLQIGVVTVARKNQDSLCWVKVDGIERVVGKIDGAVLTLFPTRLDDPAGLRNTLLQIEADPERAAALHGKASGRCSICSRDLTDPVSIERGIGPVCVEKAGWA